MRSTFDQWSAQLPEGVGIIVVLFLQLIVALALVGWAYNRGFRKAERGSLVRLPLLLVSFALALLVHFQQHVWWHSVIIALAILITGFLGRNAYARGSGVVALLLGVLLGHGLVLSAAALTMAAVLVYALSPAKQR